VLSNLDISLWPEYDRPDVLVIYRGSFESTTPLPVQAEFYLPAKVVRPTAVAWVDEAGGQFTQEYTTRTEGDWLVVSFELAVPRFQLEYYDTLPVDSTGQRQYTFTYTADYDIGSLTVDFQVPPTAEGFTLEPPADAVVSEQDTLTYHVAEVGALTKGEEKSWTFTYQKDNAELTGPALAQPEASATSAPTATQGSDNSTVLIFFIAFVVVVAVGTAAFWLGRRTQPIAQAAPRSTRSSGVGTKPGGATAYGRRGSGQRTQGPQQRSVASGTQDVLFCHECGTELRPDSDFCHRCGTKVRKV
jgi:hypothetical protein